MDRYYSTDGMNVYLVLQHTEYTDSYETRMLQNNSIPGLLPFDLMSIDGEMIPCYRVSSLKEFGVASSARLEPAAIIWLLKSLFGVLECLSDYLLSGNNLILQEDSVFCDDKMERFYFIYLPGYQMGIRGQMQALMDACIQRMHHADREQSEQIYHLYQMISEENVDIKKLQQETEQLLNKQNQTENAGMETASFSERIQLMDDVFQEDMSEDDAGAHSGIKNKMYKILLFVAMTITVLGGICWILLQYKSHGRLEHPKPLMVICMILAVELFAYMQIEKEREQVTDAGEVPDKIPASMEYLLVPIENPSASSDGLLHLPYAQTMIGRGKTADCSLTDETVSRIHARIEWTGQKFMLEDMNSTNGTFVNGYPLRPYFCVALESGDKIAFGNELFELQAIKEKGKIGDNI